MKKIMLLGGLLAAIAPASAGAAQGFGGCQLDGTAKFKTPLTVNTPTPTPSAPGGFEVPQEVDWGSPFAYTFTGNLTNCVGAGVFPASAASTGKIYAGETIKYKNVDYDWPFATPIGEGGCTGSHTGGKSVVIWADDTASVISYDTDGALALVGLTGSFESAPLTLRSVAKNPDGTAVSSVTLSMRYGGDYTGGPLAFQPPDPTACNGAGVSEAGIHGFIGHGNYS